MYSDTNSRSISDVLKNIVQNVQEIVRFEVRLARTEVGEELEKAKTVGILAGMCIGLGFFAAFFALLAAGFALTNVVANWAAALIVTGATGIGAAVFASLAHQRLKHIHPIPARTIETVKENFQWSKQRTK